MVGEGVFPKSPGDILYSSEVNDFETKKHTQNTDTALGAQSENLDMNTHQIDNVTNPTANQDAATKKYVDDKSNSGFASALTLETTTSVSFIDYNAVNTTITTSGGKVLVTATFRGGYHDQNMAIPIRITRDNETANSIEMQLRVISTLQNQSGAITWIDTPGSGAHTYEMQYRSTVGSKTAKLDLVSLSAVEI